MARMKGTAFLAVIALVLVVVMLDPVFGGKQMSQKSFLKAEQQHAKAGEIGEAESEVIAYNPFASEWSLQHSPPHVPEKGLPEIVRKWRNLVLIKVYKCMSSSIGGVVRRIGLYAGMRGVSDNVWAGKEPMVWANHMRRQELQPRIRNLRQPTFLFATVREPASRCLSHLYFGVAANAAQTSIDAKGLLRLPVDHVVTALRNCKNVMTRYMHPRDRATDVNGTFERYNFIGSADRPDETFVLLYYLLRNTPIQATIYDMLFIASKNASEAIEVANRRVGSGNPPSSHKDMTERTPFAHIPLRHPQLSQEAPEVLEYIARHFAKDNMQDIALVHMVHQRMDQLIASIPDFAETLAFYRLLQQQVRERCGPMTPPCIYKDAGCSQACINAVAKENGDTRDPVSPPPFTVQQTKTRIRAPRHISNRLPQSTSSHRPANVPTSRRQSHTQSQ